MKLTAAGISLRFLWALLLVLCTYNPSGYSYFHWVSHDLHNITPYLAICGLLLLIGWGIYVHATFTSLGTVGVLMASALFACVIWLFVYWGLLSPRNTSSMAWSVEIVLAALLCIGMCWSHVTRRMSGQVDVDQVDSQP